MISKYILLYFMKQIMLDNYREIKTKEKTVKFVLNTKLKDGKMKNIKIADLHLKTFVSI